MTQVTQHGINTFNMDIPVTDQSNYREDMLITLP